MRFGLGAAAVIAAVSATPAFAQELWQGAEVGMSTEQVLQVHPTAQAPSERSTLSSGAVCALQIRAYEVSGSAFNVCFYMISDRLSQVTLKSVTPSQPLFETMTTLLRARYGAPLSSELDRCPPNRSMRMCKHDWLLPSGTNVSILYMDIGGRDPLININYQTRIRQGGDRL